MSDTAQIMLRAYKAHVALPAFNIPYLPMMEPVTKAIADEDSFALIEVARLEFIKFEAVSQAAVKAEFDKWQNPGHMRLHQDHVPVIDEDQIKIDFLADIQGAIDLGYGSVRLGAKYQWNWSKTAFFKEEPGFLLDLQHSSNWKFYNQASISAGLTNLFSLKLGWTLAYQNQPAVGKVKTDSTTAAAIVASF